MHTHMPTAEPGPPSRVPRAIGSDEVGYAAVLERLARTHAPGARILDAPAGRGALTRLLLDAGYAVTACDVRPDVLHVPEVACAVADLNEGLPYEDASFEAVACCNGIHHVQALGRCAAEFARVLTPAGRLLLTFPNFTSVSRRLRFLFSGNASNHLTRHAAETEPRPGAWRQAVGLPQVLTALDAAGLEVVHLGGVRSRWWRLLYLPLVAFIYAVGLLYISPGRRRRYHWRRTHSWPALFDDFLVLEARKKACTSAS